MQNKTNKYSQILGNISPFRFNYKNVRRKVAKSHSKHNFICVQTSYMFRLYIAIIKMNIQTYIRTITKLILF